MSSVAVALLVAEVELVRWASKLTNEAKSGSSRWHLRRRGEPKTFCGEDLAGVTLQTSYVALASDVDVICEHCSRARLRRLLA